MALHEALQKAADVGATKGAGLALGQLVDESGNLVPAPTGAEIYAYFKGLNNTVATLTSTNQAQEQAIGALQAVVQQQADLLTQFNQVLSGKASSDSVAAVRQRVTTAEGALQQKANTAYVDQQMQTISGIDASQAQAITAIQGALGVDEGKLQSLLATQTAQGNLLSSLRTDVDLKAASVTVSTLSGQVTMLRNTVNDPTAGLAAKVNTADFTPVASAFSNSSTGLAATYTLASTAKAKADNALPLDGGTMKAGAVVANLVVPKPASSAHAARPLELYFGQQFYQKWVGLSTSTVLPTTGTALLDGFGQGLLAELVNLQGYVTKSATLATNSVLTLTATDTVTNAVTVIMTSVQVLPALMTVNNLVKFSDLVGTGGLLSASRPKLLALTSPQQIKASLTGGGAMDLYATYQFVTS